MGGDLLHTMDVFGLSRVRTELSQLLVIPFLGHHPVQTYGSFLAIATLAIRLSRRIAKWVYWRPQSGSRRTARLLHRYDSIAVHRIPRCRYLQTRFAERWSDSPHL